MLSRHEEKYIIDYRQYVLLKNRAMQVLTPDDNAVDGSYIITSLYFDDPRDHALDEKLDGLPEHSKFRLRTYDYSDGVIKLERKDKHGIMTQKIAASVTREQLYRLSEGNIEPAAFAGTAYDLAVQMRDQVLRPTVAVRYRRDAFYYPGTDLRLTFDTRLEAIRPDPEALFDPHITGIPVLQETDVIMEIKYGSHLPSFLRKLTGVNCKQLSVSKYALCREGFE